MTFEVYEDGDDRQHWVLTEEQNTIDGTTVVIGGDAQDEEFAAAVEAVVDALGEEPEDA